MDMINVSKTIKNGVITDRCGRYRSTWSQVSQTQYSYGTGFNARVQRAATHERA